MPAAIQLTDPEFGARAWIAPAQGFNCYRFEALVAGQRADLIDSPDNVLSGEARPSGFGIPILFPFPNRIRDGKFSWEGREYTVPKPAGRPDAIHGFCYDRPWRVTEQTENSVTGQFQLSKDDPDRRASWPADFLFEVRYRLIENRLECQFRIHNPDKVALPWGLGTHAYFKMPFAAGSAPGDMTFSVPVAEEWELENYLPTGRRLPVEQRAPLREGARFGAIRCDNVYTGWESDGGSIRCAISDERARVQLTQVCDAALFREAVVYTPPNRNALCIEPYTCVTDAINLHAQDLNTGLQVLAPGETVQTWIVLQASSFA